MSKINKVGSFFIPELMTCDYCKANTEGIEFRAKVRPKGSFDELLKEYGSIKTVREMLRHETDDRKRCRCEDLRLKFQFQRSSQQSTNKKRREELDASLQEILIAYKNNHCSKKSTIALLGDARSAVDVQYCRNALWKISEVDLSYCQITELPASSGNILVGLRTLNLECNYLDALPASLAKCSLERLNLGRNNFSILPSWLTKQKTLVRLNLSFNHFRSTLFENTETDTIHIVEDDDEEVNSSRNWIETVDYQHPNKVVYFNKITGEVSTKKDRGRFRKEEPRNDSTHSPLSKTEEDKNIPFLCVKELIMNNNRCDSFEMSGMTSLVVLKIHRNQISSLPPDLCHLVTLRILDVSGNKLKSLPNLEGCIALEEINISSNNIDVFPDVMALKNLRSLDISSNRVKRIPYVLGMHETLSVFKAHDNPIDDPPKGIFLEPTTSLWECRQLYYREQNGGLPSVQLASSGIRKERRALGPDFDIAVSQKIEDANSKGMALFLRHHNLSHIPHTIYTSKNLTSICLQSNQIDTLEWKEISINLVSLDLRDCALKNISESIRFLPNLQDLNLERNNLVTLPKQLAQLHELKRLFCSNNELKTLPEIFSTSLVELHLNHNRLDHLPERLDLLQDLKILCASHNKLCSIPSSIICLKKLKTLNLRQNRLQELPQKLGRLQLTQLFLSNNEIKFLPPDFFLPNLSGTITDLELNGNKLSELPYSFPMCRNAIIDMNPLKSPPLCLINEGFEAVVNYNRERHERINQFIKGLTKSGFKTSRKKFSPPVDKVIDQTGYLLPDDLIDFDLIVDSCVNGEFFFKKHKVKEIINNITDLKKRREQEMFKNILDCIINELNVIENEKSKRRLFRNVKKKFGLFESEVDCFAIPLQFVLLSHDNSIFKKVKNCLHQKDTLFSFDDAMLSEAFKFNSPFGQVAAIEQVKYTDEHNSDYQETTLPSLVIAKHIYSEEEAERRRREESILYSHFAKMEDLIAAWALTKQGMRSINAEVSRRIKHASKVHNDLKKELRFFRAESNDTMQRIKNRLKDYNDKQPFDLHFLADDNAAQQLQLKLIEMEKEIDVNSALLEQKYLNAQRRKDEKWSDVRNTALGDMNKKCCYTFYELVYRNGRAYALANKLERPWDEIGFRQYKEKCLEGGKESRVVTNDITIRLQKLLESTEIAWTQMDDMNMKKYEENEPYTRGYKVDSR